jgi:hypothetical protein
MLAMANAGCDAAAGRDDATLEPQASRRRPPMQERIHDRELR